jgi:hypothetical protein
MGGSITLNQYALRFVDAKLAVGCGILEPFDIVILLLQAGSLQILA